MKTKIWFAAALLVLSQALIAQNNLTNDKIWASREFNVNYVSGFTSMRDGIHYTRLVRENNKTSINKYDYKKNGLKGTLVSTENLKYNGKSIEIQTYAFNKDETKLLIGDELESIYRRSSKGNYYIYDLQKKQLLPLTDFAKGKQSVPQFSPDASKVAFMRGNNLYVRDFTNNSELAITQDGEWNKVINGMCDWVYEEEFGFDKAWAWNSNGTKIAYYRFDESQVKEFNMAMYGELYPTDYKFKYPKAGEKNSDVGIVIYDVTTKNTNVLNLGPEKDQYIPRIKWTLNPEILCVMRMNRLQNKLELLSFDANRSVQTGIMYSEANDTYVEVTDNLYFLADNSFITTSEKDGFNHIYRFSSNGKFLGQITKGNWDVNEIYGVDESSKTIYYQSSESDPSQRDIYSIGFDGSKKTKLSTKAGTNSAEFSANFSYFINTHSSANTPPEVTLHEKSGKLVSLLEGNEKLKETLAGYALPKKEFMRIKTENGVFNAWMIKPNDFDATKKYPVFMTVYQGPGSNTVNDSWDSKNLLWHSLLAQKGIIVVSVDGRGTGNRGADWKKSTYKQLGKLETEDQIAAAKYLGTLPFVDAKRIGIQGWSYGGYMTLLCLTKGSDVFKMGISVAPVTTWRYYDSIYTERYLQRPQDNPDGYDQNSPITFAKQLTGKLLLVHGSADDNVHYQNSMDMIDALVKNNREFDLMIYPNKNHGIYGGLTRLHLYNKMTNYILENL
ncbi:MAG TPA: DPP IV N-terminal domain-containing protein [Luteibaculaceae bacterium]|nr:DPP IV N-terminal domain-containing protein [Luteibaculaceae bacterium]